MKPTIRRHLPAPLRRLTRGPAIAAVATLAVIPFGSLGALQDQIVSGKITDKVPQGKVLCSRWDDTARVFYKVAEIKRHPPKRPAVYLFGGSSMRECIVGVGGLREQIRERSGVDVKVVNLASTEQKLSAALAIVDNLPAAEGGVIVIGIHHPPFTHGTGSATRQLHGNDLLVRSTALRDFLQNRLGTQQNASLNIGLTRYLTKYEAKRGVPAFGAPPLTYRTHRYPQTMTISMLGKLDRVNQWLTGRGRPNGPFFHNFGLNAAIVDKLTAMARDKGYEVVFSESSQNATVIGRRFDPYRKKYRALCRKMVDEHGAHYINLNRSAGLVNADFYDLVHLHPSGQAKWQPQLAAAIATVMIDHPPAGASPSPSPSSEPSSSSGTSPSPSAPQSSEPVNGAQSTRGFLDKLAARLAGLATR